eukprot:GHVU01081754.1.p1 GENE.GHVU01081754.1~~GHVU01081754.1.p1  ORF type:complete len:112 (+),score=1.76 GHVU01081754.1:311-646(+)
MHACMHDCMIACLPPCLSPSLVSCLSICSVSHQSSITYRLVTYRVVAQLANSQSISTSYRNVEIYIYTVYIDRTVTMVRYSVSSQGLMFDDLNGEDNYYLKKYIYNYIKGK